ncbi:MAG: hypothetical protein EYC70_15540 [Planctomycetota bacterium]|nr:MAG: hypothetical protein EYC70_15540 [Planctomycetota bacterium]
MSTRLRSRWLLCFALGLAAPGCLSFQKQTLLMRVDPAEDTLRVRLIYEGWHHEPLVAFGQDKNPDHAEMARSLASLDHALCFFTPLLWLDLQDAEPEVAEFAAHFRILAHGHFLNPEGKLSSWQDVQLSDLTELLGRVNRGISRSILEDRDEGGAADDEFDAETRKLLRERAQEGHSWIRLDASGISFHLAASASQWKRWKADVLADVARDDEEGAIWRNFLVENPLSFVQDGVAGIFSVAASTDGLITLQIWNDVDSYDPAFLEFLRGGDLPHDVTLRIDEDQTLATLLEEF